MQTKNIRAVMLALLTVTLFFGTRQGARAGFPGRTNDDTASIGQFSIVVFTNFQTLMANSGFPPSQYNPATHIFLSPVLYDDHTLIGRSDVLHDGDANDTAGVLVGTAGTNVSDSMLTVKPGGLGPVGTREVHTMVYSLRLTPPGVSFGPPAVRAGTNAPTQPMSFGEVESWSGAAGTSAVDFPAQSFFDVFVEVDIPAAPAPTGPFFPGATNLYNDLPLMIQNTNVTTFPPQVVYVHGMSTAVPIKFRGANPPLWTNGQIFGLLTLAGHGVFPTNNPGTTATFLNTMSTVTPAPVEPQYSNKVGAPVTLANSNTMIFPAKNDDNTTSLGTFTLAVNPNFQNALTINSYPNWSPTTKRLTSPLLYDPSTKIGRSAPLTEGTPVDTSGVPVGTANTSVGDVNIALFPPFFESPSNTFEVKTEVRTLNMANGGVAVRAGTAAPGSPGSYGSVESLSGPSGDPYWDFPAKSFFDVFVQVDLPGAGAIPPFTVANGTPLVVQNNNLTTFPPQVIYVHGNSSAVPVMFTTNVPAIGAQAGDVFGILLLSGHGISYTPSDTSKFQQAMAQIPEEPVAPQYATWAPYLNVPLQISGISISNGIPHISGYCSSSSTLTLQSTPSLIGGPVWVDEVTTTGTTNSTFIVAPPTSTTSVKFYRMVDNTR